MTLWKRQQVESVIHTYTYTQTHTLFFRFFSCACHRVLSRVPGNGQFLQDFFFHYCWVLIFDLWSDFDSLHLIPGHSSFSKWSKVSWPSFNTRRQATEFSGLMLTWSDVHRYPGVSSTVLSSEAGKHTSLESKLWIGVGIIWGGQGAKLGTWCFYTQELEQYSWAAQRYWWLFWATLAAKLAGFPGGSADKESAWSAADHSSISELGRSSGEGIGYSLQYSWTSLVAQLGKNPRAMWETWVRSLGWEEPLENGMATHSSILA